MTGPPGSLFEPADGGVLASAVQWLEGTLLGTVAMTLCVVAVAVVGLSLLSGRLAIRDGVRVVIGCFVLFGAPLIAASLRDLAGAGNGYIPADTARHTEGRAPIAPSTYDPYAGASLRDDRSGE